MSNQLISRKKKRLFYTVLAFLNLFVCVGLYLGIIVSRSKQVYNTESSWIDQPYRVDKNLGYFPEPYALAYHSLRYREPIPVIFDENGFRIPYTEENPGGPTDFRILFLGDSFTHGYGVPAEKTFAYLTASELNASAMNAGGSGWGLAQMVIRARDVISRLKPDLVIVQYTSWLPDRSMSFYQSTQWGKSPMPYFFESNGGLDIHQPAFHSIFLNLPIPQFAGEDKDLLPFVWHIGIPIFVHDDYQVLRTSLKHRLGLLPSPIASKQSVIDYGYQEIQRLCDVNGARMMILVLPHNINDRLENQLDAFSAVVDVLEPLARKLPEHTLQAWRANYYFWGGDPPQMVDGHPNAQMHVGIAEILVEAIRLFLPESSERGAESDAPADVQHARR